VSSGELDCRTCGACCRGRAGTVLVVEEDLVRWRRANREDLEQSLVPGHFSLPGLDTRGDGRCIHQGTPESPLDCSIHAIRPNTCRDFAASSPECLAVRRRGGREWGTRGRGQM